MRQSPSKVELLLHPVRLRIMLALGRREVSTDDLCSLLPDLSRATVYRQLTKLIDGGAITVVKVEKVRGTTKRTLRRSQEDHELKREHSEPIDPEDLSMLLQSFFDGLLSHGSGYLKARTEPVPLEEFAFWGEMTCLDESERDSLVLGVRRLVENAQAKKPNAARKAYLVAFMSLPSQS